MGIFKSLSPRLQRGQPLAQGLVGAWEFTEGSGLTVYDSSGYRNHGTLTGSPLPLWTGGRAGSVLSFNNTAGQFVQLADPVPTPGSTTIAGWIYIVTQNSGHLITALTTQPVSGAAQGVAINYNQSPGGGYSASNNFTFWVGNGGWYVVIAPGTLNLLQWTHVCGTFDGATSTQSLYLNGILCAQAVHGSLAQPSSFSTLGGWGGSGSTSSTINGLLDDVRAYNRALSAAEVAQLYQMTGP